VSKLHNTSSVVTADHAYSIGIRLLRISLCIQCSWVHTHPFGSCVSERHYDLGSLVSASCDTCKTVTSIPSEKTSRKECVSYMKEEIFRWDNILKTAIFDDFHPPKNWNHQNRLIFTKSWSNGTIIIMLTFETISDNKQLVCGASVSIELHSFVCYSPRDVNRIADKLNNAVQSYVFYFFIFLVLVSYKL